MTDSAVADNIKLFVHIVGDMHCPGHAFYTGYDQKNIYFKLNGKKPRFMISGTTGCLTSIPGNIRNM